MIRRQNRDWRIVVAVLALLCLAFVFWSSSRYPALNEKALMGGDTPLSGLSFDIVYEILPGSSIWWELSANTLNWISTNLKGMTFGVLFGAAALTTLSLIKKRTFDNSFANSALGTVIGAPLGVCVNCAVPIAVGLHMGRMRLETTLSALLASPTLNVIVVTMSFSLLPLHMAVIKLALALVMVLLVVPLLCKFVLKEETESTRNNVAKMVKISEAKGFTAWIARALTPVQVEPGPHGPLISIWWFARTYARSFFFIFIITVPMMFLAAVLGAVVATFVSPTELTGLLPRGSIPLVLLAIVATALISSFVPAPIALDVILTTILINIGLREDYATAALIGLGSFSVYAFIVLWKTISLRTAFALWAAVIVMSISGAILAHISTPSVEKYYRLQQLTALNSVDSIDWPIPPALPEGIGTDTLRSQLAGNAVTREPLAANIDGTASGTITVTKASSNSNIAQSGEITRDKTRFSRIVGTDIGLAEKGVNSSIRNFGYYMMRGGITAGDIHGDGWVDIITRRPDHATGLSVYANIGGRFQRQKLDLGIVDDSEIFNVALADIDGDANLDLMVSTIMHGDHVFFNEDGNFSAANMVSISSPSPAVINNFAFADMDQDGDIDIVAGKWVPRGIAEVWGIRPQHIRNEIYWNEGNRNFKKEILPGIPGQTLSGMISDFNGDGYLDYFNADDAGATDSVTFFGKDGKIIGNSRDMQPFAYHTRSSMSYDQGDWNGDLKTDYYGAQIAMGTGGGTNMRRQSQNRVLHEICSQYGRDLRWDEVRIQICAKNLLSMDLVRSSKSGKGFDSCKLPVLKRDKALCGAASIFPDHTNNERSLSGDQARFAQCEKLLSHMPAIKIHCASLLIPAIAKPTKKQLAREYRPGIANGNILMTATENNIFTDLADQTDVRAPGWSWNSRFIDLDQDSRLDILVMTGIWLNSASSTSNIFYHNNGKTFSNDTDEFGFYDLTPSYSYVALDYDRDGDIDIIRDNSALRMIVHRNDRPAGAALTVNLRDRIGNSLGIGSRVIICVDGETKVRSGNCQRRDIKASGGYMSSDPIYAHFGLGKAKSVSMIQVRWPDGKISSIKPESLSSGEITITRS